jgi:hypothetical protein
MMTDRRTRLERWSLAAAVLVALAVPGPAAAQLGGADRFSDPPVLWISVDASGRTHASLMGSHPTGVRDALAAAFGGPAEVEGPYGLASVRVTGGTAFRRSALAVAGRVDLTPLAEALRAAGHRSLLVWLRHGPAGYSHCTLTDDSAEESGGRGGRYSESFDTDRPISVGLEFGYSAGDLLRLLPLVALMALALVAARLIRAAALRTPGHPETRWLRFQWSQGLLVTLTWLAWIIGVPIVDAGRMAQFLGGAIGPGCGWVAELILLLVPPLAVEAAIAAMAAPVYRMLRRAEPTRRDLTGPVVWGTLTWPGLVLLIGLGVAGWVDGSAAVGLALGVSGLVFWLVAVLRWVRAVGGLPVPLPDGDLRDRVRSLARRVKYKVRQVHRLTERDDRRGELLTGFGPEVWLSDRLLTDLGRREVDAVVAQELADQRKRRSARTPAFLVCILIAYFGTALGLVLARDPLTGMDPHLPEPARWVVPALVALVVLFRRPPPLFKPYRLAAADRVALARLGDPEALVTGLVKLARLRFPAETPGPATVARAGRIARNAGLPPDRLAGLLAGPEIDPSRYPVPAEAVPPGRTAENRQLALLRALAVGLGLLYGPPLAAAHLADRWPSAAPWLWLAGLVMPVVLFWLMLLVPLWGNGRLRRDLKAALDRAGFADLTAAGALVGLAPGARLRRFDGFPDWDVGFLVLDADRLIYLGERGRFALGFDQVTEVGLTEGEPTWRPLGRVRVRWASPDGARAGAFSLAPLDVACDRQLHHATRALLNGLRDWQAAAEPAALRMVPRALPAVGPEDVAGEPVVGVRLTRFLIAATILAGLGTLIAWLTGLPFAAAWSVPVTVVVLLTLIGYPSLILRPAPPEPDPPAPCPPGAPAADRPGAEP